MPYNYGLCPRPSTHPESRNFAISSLLPCRKRAAAGATQAEADVSLQQGLNVTVRLGEVETIEYQRDRALGITVYFNGAKGSASSADLRPEAVRAMVAKACSIARHHRARRICRAWPMPPTWHAICPTSISTIPGR